jgi:hypothetical protein
VTVRGFVEDLTDLGRDGAWEALCALSEYFETGRTPTGLSGEVKLTVAAFIGRDGR